jgi:hypothetical protein
MDFYLFLFLFFCKHFLTITVYIIDKLAKRNKIFSYRMRLENLYSIVDNIKLMLAKDKTFFTLMTNEKDTV